MATISHSVRNAISGLAVDYVSDGHSSGLGELAAATVDTVTWQAPGSSTAGSPVAIADGEVKIVTDGDDSSEYIVVRRTSASDLSGTAQVLVSAIKSTGERLAEADAAVSSILRAQSEGYGDARVFRAALDKAVAYRDSLERRYHAEQGTRSSVATVDLRGRYS